jgi:pimeloyl-ACP methyl ester carboxylesterase
MNGAAMGEVGANGLTFTVRHAGPDGGRPIILLHGFPQTSACFDQTTVALGRAGYRVLAPDQRGYSPGARPPAVADYGLVQLVSDVLALADASGMESFDLVGHDWGGMVGWWVAARHPDRVRTFTAVSTPHPAALASALADDADQAQRSSYLEVFRQADVPERLLLGDDGGSGLQLVFADSAFDPAAVSAYIAVLSAPGALTAALNWYRANDLHAHPDLGPVVVPTMYVWSTEDIALGRRAAEATADQVTGPYRFEELEGVSHWIPDVAADSLNRLLLDHLDGSVGSTLE